MSIFNAFVKFLSSGSKVEPTTVETLLKAPAPKLPKWLVDLNKDPKSYFEKKLKGVTVVSAGGELDGSAPMVLAHVISYHNEGRIKGCPLFASSEDGKEFAWVAVQPRIEGRLNPEAYIQNVDPETGDVEDNAAFPQARIKFKLSGKNSSISSWSAIAELEAYLEAGDGRRRELLVLMQLSGNEAAPETDARTGAISPDTWLQQVGGWVIVEVPSLKAKPTFGALPLAAAPVVKPNRKAKKAVLSETLAQAAVKGELPAPAPSPIATGDDL